MIAKQFYISESVIFFKSAYEEFGLKCVNIDGYNENEPCVFIGMYRHEDIKRFENHKGASIIVWMGCDAENETYVKYIFSKNPTKKIVISHVMKTLFNSYGLETELVHLPNTDINFWKPTILKNCVYSYAPNNHYGRDVIIELSKHIDYELILTDSCKHYTRDELDKLYDRCFVGIRLRNMDGSAASVVEMSLKGRRTISNIGSLPCIGWDSIEDVIEKIKSESIKIGTYQNNFAEKAFEFYNIGDSWLKV